MKARILAVALVAVVVIFAVGMSLLYLQNESTMKEMDRIAIKQEMRDTLDRIGSAVWSEMGNITKHLNKASDELRTTGLDGEDARAVLADLKAKLPYAVDVVTIDRTGVIVAAYPSEYSDVEGVDISDQPQVQEMLRTMRPVASDVFVMAEGFPASDMESPVFDPSGMFIGSVSAAIDLSAMMKDIVDACLDRERFQFTCLQIDGTEIYDSDGAQIGKNLFNDSVYADHPEMLEFMQSVVDQRDGYGTYRFYRSLDSQDLVDKQAYWTSFGMTEANWRLMVIHVM
jgi:hypothetical protein